MYYYELLYYFINVKFKWFFFINSTKHTNIVNKIFETITLKKIYDPDIKNLK